MWMAFVGGAVGIALGTMVFGGLGQNVFNPALLGRAFLQAAFPVVITTWARHHQGFLVLAGDTLALPFMTPQPLDGTTSATPLGLLKFEGKGTGLLDLFIGRTGGRRQTCDRDPRRRVCSRRWGCSPGACRSRFASVAVLSTTRCCPPTARTAAATRSRCSGPGPHPGAVYMATDPVTSPI
jgi:electron transport complex protein RnfD